MAEQKEDGGPAFPQGIDQGASEVGFPIVEHTGGLTIRDFFAASALISMRAHPANEQPQHIGDWSFKVADAMLEARKK